MGSYLYMGKHHIRKYFSTIKRKFKDSKKVERFSLCYVMVCNNLAPKKKYNSGSFRKRELRITQSESPFCLIEFITHNFHIWENNFAALSPKVMLWNHNKV